MLLTLSVYFIYTSSRLFVSVYTPTIFFLLLSLLLLSPLRCSRQLNVSTCWGPLGAPRGTPKAPRGPSGAPSPWGTSGAPSPWGPPGAFRLWGPPRALSRKGSPGAPSSKGPPGAPSSKGPPGAPSSKGAPGAPSSKGAPGAPRSKGPPGALNRKGPPRAPRSRGPPGALVAHCACIGGPPCCVFLLTVFWCIDRAPMQLILIQ